MINPWVLGYPIFTWFSHSSQLQPGETCWKILETLSTPQGTRVEATPVDPGPESEISSHDSSPISLKLEFYWIIFQSCVTFPSLPVFLAHDYRRFLYAILVVGLGNLQAFATFALPTLPRKWWTLSRDQPMGDMSVGNLYPGSHTNGNVRRNAIRHNTPATIDREIILRWIKSHLSKLFGVSSATHIIYNYIYTHKLYINNHNIPQSLGLSENRLPGIPLGLKFKELDFPFWNAHFGLSVSWTSWQTNLPFETDPTPRHRRPLQHPHHNANGLKHYGSLGKSN